MASASKNIPEIIVFFHYPCLDGVAGAWVIRDHLPESSIRFYGMSHESSDEETENRILKAAGIYTAKATRRRHAEIYFVDYVPNNVAPIERLLAKGHKVNIIDHHQTAESNLKQLQSNYSKDILRVEFDADLSGATITWKVLHRGESAPEFLQLIDRIDTLRFKNDEEKYFACYLDGLKMDKNPSHALLHFSTMKKAFESHGITHFAQIGALEYDKYLPWINTMKQRATLTKISSSVTSAWPLKAIIVPSGGIKKTPRGIQNTLIAELMEEKNCGVILLVDASKPPAVKVSVRVHPDHSDETHNITEAIVAAAYHVEQKLHPSTLKRVAGGGRGIKGQIGQAQCRMPDTVARALGLMGKKFDKKSRTKKKDIS